MCVMVLRISCYTEIFTLYLIDLLHSPTEPGKLEFGSPSYVVKESQRKALIPVRRFNGADGHVSVKWRSKNMSATDGKHFKGGDGLLEFANGETIKMIEIPIITTQVTLILLVICLR